MKVLVTGGAGFIGSHVVDALREKGAEVICLDSLDPGVYHYPPDYLRPDVDYCFADLRHWKPDERFDDVEYVIHLAALGGVGRAAREPANIIEANCLGTARLLDAARGWPKLSRIILASSFSVYGANYTYRCSGCGTEAYGVRHNHNLDKGYFEVLCQRCEEETTVVPVTEAAPPSPLETYGASKFMQELCFRGFDHSPVTILRFSSVYGKRLRLDDGEATIIARIAGWIRSGKRPSLYEDGRQIRDWVYVGDLVAAMMALIDGRAAPPVINVCSGVPTRLTEACEHISAAYGVDCPAEVVGGYRPGDMRHCLGDASTLSQLLGRQPIAFREGAKLTFGSGE
ncbi:MAG TPA: NAD-dependent epimerase/dehydratase family protein [Pyrinomonadaceae bacterium]|nr:NAD-dependent epimerase/dehydratase family protein [Pyrinomonadaceae bacterium]